MLAVVALVGITGVVYWIGYNDVDRRHRNDGKESGSYLPTVLTIVKFGLRRVDGEVEKVLRNTTKERHLYIV